MDKLKFAKMINLLSLWGLRELDMREIQELDSLVTPDPILNSQAPSSQDRVNNLLAAMLQVKDGKKIEAIKCYRDLTNAGLKESKEAVERYSA